MSVASKPPNPRDELSALIEAGLNHPLTEPEKFEGLVAMQSRLRAEQERLAELLSTDQISRQRYILRLDSAMKNAALTGKDLLRAGDFEKIFGEFRVGDIIDVQAFVEGRAPQDGR